MMVTLLNYTLSSKSERLSARGIMSLALLAFGTEPSSKIEKNLCLPL